KALKACLETAGGFQIELRTLFFGQSSPEKTSVCRIVLDQQYFDFVIVHFVCFGKQPLETAPRITNIDAWYFQV
ncbi:MAG TPA: hypothetical protein VJM77_04160, partial [Nitrospiria bacterium]|nr:hypothetical protein [Nitrospiria bacterium]